MFLYVEITVILYSFLHDATCLSNKFSYSLSYFDAHIATKNATLNGTRNSTTDYASN